MKDETLSKEAEWRLYHYPELCGRIAQMKQEIAALENMEFDALCCTSGSVIHSSGRQKSVTDPTERFAAQATFLRSRVALYGKEVRILRKALKAVRADPYYKSLEYKYFRRMTDNQAAVKMNCSLSTLRRNRQRLLCIVVNILYNKKGENNE